MTAPAIKDTRQCKDCNGTFTCGPFAKWCPHCRWKQRAPKHKYEWTPERDALMRHRYDSRVKGRVVEIAASLKFPKWAVTRRAQHLGLAHTVDRKEWTAKEETFLIGYSGRRHLEWLARKLDRPVSSVTNKLKRMKISRAWREGYTLRELELCFGCDHHGIERWVREGQLQISRRGTCRQHDAWYVTDRQILDFLFAHPMAFRLDKVDQVWFMDMMASVAKHRSEVGQIARNG